MANRDDEWMTKEDVAEAKRRSKLPRLTGDEFMQRMLPWAKRLANVIEQEFLDTKVLELMVARLPANGLTVHDMSKDDLTNVTVMALDYYETKLVLEFRKMKAAQAAIKTLMTP